MWLSYAEPLTGTFFSFKYPYWITGKSKITKITSHLNNNNRKEKIRREKVILEIIKRETWSIYQSYKETSEMKLVSAY